MVYQTLMVISCQTLFMHIYQIYMNCKRIIFTLTFLDKPELICLRTVILGAIFANTGYLMLVICFHGYVIASMEIRQSTFLIGGRFFSESSISVLGR